MKLRPSLDILILILMCEHIIRVAAQPGKVASLFNFKIVSKSKIGTNLSSKVKKRKGERKKAAIFHLVTN